MELNHIKLVINNESGIPECPAHSLVLITLTCSRTLLRGGPGEAPITRGCAGIFYILQNFTETDRRSLLKQYYMHLPFGYKCIKDTQRAFIVSIQSCYANLLADACFMSTHCRPVHPQYGSLLRMHSPQLWWLEQFATGISTSTE